MCMSRCLDIDEVSYINKHLFTVFREGFSTCMYTAYKYEIGMLFLSPVLLLLNNRFGKEKEKA